MVISHHMQNAIDTNVLLSRQPTALLCYMIYLDDSTGRKGPALVKYCEATSDDAFGYPFT